MKKTMMAKGQISIFDIMPKRDLISDGYEISEDRDVEELVGTPLDWDSVSPSRDDYLWMRYDLSCGTVYEAFRVLNKDDKTMDIIDGSYSRRIYRKSLERAHGSGSIYSLRQAA